jgi:gliding motility-associated-like protein
LSSTSIQNPTVTGITSTTSYQISVTDQFGCAGIDYVIVNVSPSTLQANAGNGASICASSGSSVTLGGSPTAAGGTSPYTYLWSNNSTVSNPVVSPTTTTVYRVTVTDSKGCTSIDSVRVSLNGSVTVSAGRDTTVCAGFPVVLGGTPTASGGTSPYQYSWTPTLGLNANNASNPIAVAPSTTIYTVQVIDSNGCIGSASVRVGVRPTPRADAGPDRDITGCVNDTVFIGGSPSASGGTGPYTYAWSPATALSSTSISNPYVTGLTTSQNYGLLVTDNFGCTSTDAVLVNYVPSTLQARAGLNTNICFGSTSSVTLGGTPTAIGGTSPYTYSWSNGSAAPNPVVSPVTTTTYYVTVTDRKGCTSVDSIRVTVRPQPTANAGSDTTICSEVQVRLGNSPTASGGGGGPFTYLWSPTIGLSNPNVANPIATPAATTTYCVTVTDVNGCTASSCIILTVNPRPRADAGPDRSLVACSADSVQIGGTPSATGGSGSYLYSWSPNVGLSSSTVSNPWVSRIGSTSTYTLVVTDLNTGCSASDQVQVNVANTSLVAEAGNDVTFCQGSAVSVTLGGSPTAAGGVNPYSYSWYANSVLVPAFNNNPNPLVSPSATTIYTVEVTDAAGCVASDFVTITINPRPLANAGLPDTICAGECRLLGTSQTASLGTPPYTYLWTPSLGLNSTTIPNPQACPTATTTFSVTVTDSLGCTNSSSVTIRVNPNPVANAGADVQYTNCELASVQIGGSPTATGGTGQYSYVWNPSTGLNSTGLSNPTVSGISVTTNYTVTVFDDNGCTASDDVLVTVIQSTLRADAGPDKSICAGQSSGVLIGGQPSVQGGTLPYNIQWSPLAGLNSFTIQNPTANPTTTTEYILLVRDALGCISIDSMVLTANPQVTVAVSYSDSIICAGSCIALGGNPTASGGTPGFTYLWSPGAGLNSITTANPVACPPFTTTYSVTVTDNVGCSSSTTQTITVNPNPVADAGPDKAITQCPGAFAYLGGSPTATAGSGNYFYSWSPATGLNGTTLPNPVVTNVTITTTYCVTVTDAVTGCTSTDCMILTVNPSNLQADAGLDKLLCANSNSCVNIGGNPTASGGFPQYIYQWSPATGLNNSNIANPCANPINTTQYFVTVTDAQGCFSVDSVTVNVGRLISADAGPDVTVCSGSDVVIGGTPTGFGGTGTLTYSWNPGNNLSSTTVSNPTVVGLAVPGSYTVVVTDSLGCSASDLVAVSVRALPTANAGPDVIMTACTADTAVLGGNPTATGTQGPYTYSWFPPVQGLITPTDANPLITNLGVSTLFTVVVTDNFGCTNQDQVQVTVLPNTVIANAGGSLISSICSGTGQCVTLGGSPAAFGGVPPYTFNWLPGPGLSGNLNSPNPTACPTQTTTYTLLVADFNGCSSFDTIRVVVNPLPTASISGLASEYCTNSPQVVMIGIPGGPTGQFSGNGVSGNVFNPSVAGAGTWQIRYAYTDPSTGCLDDTVIVVTVHPSPVISISGVEPQYCLYADVDTFFATPAGGTYTGPGMNGDVFNPAVAGVGNHNVTYSYTDGFGCSASINFTVRVVPAPTVSLATATGRDTVCAGASIVVVPTYSVDVFNIFWFDINGTQLSSGLNPVTVNPTGVDYSVIAEAISTPGFCRSRDTIVIHVNQSPIAIADNASLCEDETVLISVLNNDSDPEGDANTVTIAVQPVHGTVVNNNGVITYTPTPNYNGADSFRYTICNTQCTNACSSAWVTISICSINDNPTIVNVRDTTCRNEPLIVCPQIADVDGEPLTVTAIACNGQLNGTLTASGDSCFRYTPDPNWSGIDTICMTVCDQSNACATATAIITVLACNHAPTAVDDIPACGKYRTAFDIDFGDVLTVTGFPCPPIRGTAFVNSSGGITYTPGPGANALSGDTFCYRVCDNGIPVLCDTAYVFICIENSVVAVDDNATTGLNNPVVINVITNDFDPEGDTFGITDVLNTGNGTAVLNPDGTITFTPNVNAPCDTTDSFQYVITDALGAIDTGTVYVYIICCPRPDAVNDFITMLGNTTTTYNLLGNDLLSGTPLVTTIIQGPSHGAVQLNNGVITYTPVTGFCNDVDSIRYAISSICGRDTATAYINVKCNRAPVVANDVTNVCVDSILNFQPLANDIDPDTGDVLTIVAITIPTPNLGSATLVGNTVVFAPNGTLGTTTITYQVCDNGVPSLCSSGTITITIDTSCYRHAPITDVMYDTTLINTTLTACADLYVTDIDGDVLSITGFCDPADNGTVTLTTGLCFTYAPNPGFVGNDTFCLVVCDATGLCSNLTVIITVLDTVVVAVPDLCDLNTTTIGAAVLLNVTGNDVLPIATDTVITIIVTPANGTAAPDRHGNVLYTPNPTYVGLDTFIYQVCAVTRNYSFCSTAKVCVTVSDTTCTIPNGFSPNGDGVNDVFVIPCNEDFPKADLVIFSRWGDEVWRSNGHYNNDWDGKNQQKTVLPDGTYYLIYNYNDGTNRREARFVVIHR